MNETCERRSNYDLCRKVLLNQYVTKVVAAVKNMGCEADCDDIWTVLRNFRSDVIRQSFDELLSDIKENCQEETYTETMTVMEVLMNVSITQLT